MKLHRLHLCNFRQHADSRIEFESGITGIIGPNGAGKTTILEAIAWALYGNSAARGTRETIRFSRAVSRATVRVELEFELGGHRYRVVRGLTMAELYLDGASAPIANSISGVAEVLHRRLGMTRAEFFNTYFTGQKELNVMAAMKPSERAQFLSRVLGYEKLRTAQELVRERRKLIVAEVGGLRSGMRDPEVVAEALAAAQARVVEATTRAAAALARRTQSEATLSGIVPRWENAQHERDRLQELLSELRVVESEHVGLGRDAERIERELAEVASARAELEGLAQQLSTLEAVATEFQQLESLAREEGRRQTLQDSERALSEELVRLGDRLAQIEQAPELEVEVTTALEAARTELEGAERAWEARRTVWVRDKQEAETKRQALRGQYTELREQRERLVAAGEEGICPTCNRPLGGHYRSVLDLLDSQLETVRVDGNYYKSRMEQLEESPEEVRKLDERRRSIGQEVAAQERRLAKVQSAVQERLQLHGDIAAKEQRRAALAAELGAIPTGYDAERHRHLRREIERLQPIDARAGRLGAAIDREPQLRRDQERTAMLVAAAAERLRDLGQRRDAVAFSEKEFSALRTAYDYATADVHAAELDAVAAQSEASNAMAVLKDAEAARTELARTEAELSRLQGERAMHDELDRAYSDLRTDLNFQLRPELSELASAFLTELTDARYSELELDDQYNIIVLEDGLAKPVISGGEEDIANLVLRLAISQMIAERAGQSFSLLVLDEIFGSLDEARRHNVVDLLRHIGDRFEQVILITHIESVREGLDQVITVRLDEASGASHVERVAGGRALASAGDDIEDDAFAQAGD
jgi:DNA repair protein SbcC/Rad50